MQYRILLGCLKKYHNGADKAASSSVLEAAFAVTGREIRTAVNALRSDGEPVCSDENGYYYAANEQELQHSVRQLESRIAKMHRAKSGLEQALTHYPNKEKEAAHGTSHI